MKFGLLAALQLPKPWKADSELRLWRDGLEQMEVADRNGIDYMWQVEHHFLEEYSHSSAAETFLAAASQRTKRMRLGSGITLIPPNYNHPARVAERVAALDLVSRGERSSAPANRRRSRNSTRSTCRARKSGRCGRNGCSGICA